MSILQIDVDWMPKGFEAVAYMVPEAGDYYFGSGGIRLARIKFENLWLVVRKKQPRRIDNNESYDPSSPNGFD